MKVIQNALSKCTNSEANVWPLAKDGRGADFFFPDGLHRPKCFGKLGVLQTLHGIGRDI